MYNIDIENYPVKEMVDMSIVTMNICSDGICCVTDSRVLDENKEAVSDEIFKSTIIKNVNGYDLLVGIAGAGTVGDKEIIHILNERFDNTSIKVEFGIENLLYTVCSHLQTIKTDNLETSVVFGYYENNQPRIAIFEVSRVGINSLFTTSRYAIVGEGQAREDINNAVNALSLSTVDEFARQCIKATRDIIYKHIDEKNYGVGGYVNVIALDKHGAKNISL